MKTNNPTKRLVTAILASAMAMIAMPATVIADGNFAAGEKIFETQIGKLEFNNGYASPETSKRCEIYAEDGLGRVSVDGAINRL